MSQEQTQRSETELAEAVASLRSALLDDLAHAKRNRKVTVIIGSILVLFILVYMTWLAAGMRRELAPETLAETIAGIVASEMPGLIEQTEDNLEANCAQNVQQLREGLVAALPGVREGAEEATYEVLDIFMDDIEKSMRDLLTQMVEENKEDIEPLIEAASTPEGAKELRKSFRDSLEELLQHPEMVEALTEYERTLAQVEQRLDHLSKPRTDLSLEDRIEKEWITTVLIFLDDTVKEAE